MNLNGGTFSIFPSILKGNGTGHLLRCCDLAEKLGPGAHLVLSDADAPGFFSKDQVFTLLEGKLCRSRIVFSFPLDPGVIILDNRTTAEDLYRKLSPLGPVIALDENGPARDSAQYVIDTFPRLRGGRANIQSCSLLDLPETAEGLPERRGVLVSFGGEDPAGLTEALVKVLVPEFFLPGEITVIHPTLAEPPDLPSGVILTAPVPDLKQRLGGYELVFCSFGLTAFEACAAGSSVILLNPTPYHRDLGRTAGFADIGTGRPHRKKLKRLLSDRPALRRRCRGIVPPERSSLAALLSRLDFHAPRGCPVCGKNVNPAVARFETSTYFRCNRCDLVYLEDFSGYRASYGGSYFFEEYRRHYGKTYLEDFDALRNISAQRIAIIKRMCRAGKAKPRLLDVGCAYGPFLLEAKAAGFDPHGIDPVPEAAAYVTGTLGVPAEATSLEEYNPRRDYGGGYDVITMWYVIEHFPDLDGVLKKVSGMLVPGGVFAFSTPNLRGISALRDRDRFLESGPADHRSIFSPSSVKKILKGYGLSLERIRITGHHPERFPPGPAVLYACISRAFGLGDTFEAYAVKTGAL